MRSRYLTPPRIAGHLLVAAVLAATLLLSWWQTTRWESADGSLQNFGYALQWPFFGCFAVFLWIRQLRSDPSATERPQPCPVRASQPSALSRRLEESDDPEDQETAAYNRYLAELHAQDSRS